MACVSDQSNQLPWEHLCSVRSLWVNHNCKCHCWETYNASVLVHVQDAELCHFHWWLLSWAFSKAGPDICFGTKKRSKKNNSSHSSHLTGYTGVLSDEMQGSVMTSELKSLDFVISFPMSYYSQGEGGRGRTGTVRGEMTPPSPSQMRTMGDRYPSESNSFGC